MLAKSANEKEEEMEVVFVGDGEEDLVDIVRRQFVRFVNEKAGYTLLSMKEESGSEV